MANGAARIGRKERNNPQMLLVLILMRHVTTHWIVLVDHMTKIVLILKDAVQRLIGN
jgi:hypothetical protein